MNSITTVLALVVGAALAAPAFAQSNQQVQTQETRRDVNQQQRIESGLKSGELTAKEAGRLENEEKRVDQMEAHAAANGRISAKEQRRIDAAQSKVSKDIYAQKHDAQTANPKSATERRLQADVQRDVNQERRIERGVKSGELTTKEAGALERQQAGADRLEAKAAADGKVSAKDQHRIARAERHDSRSIHNQKHDDETR